MKIGQSLAGLCLLAFLGACGGGGGGSDTGQSIVAPQPSVPTNQLVSLTRYTGPTKTFQKIDLMMPANGILDFSLIGTRVRLFDSTMKLVGESSYTPGTTYQVNLMAGAYIVEYEYWSANSRDAVAYSPTLLAFGNLPQLKNAVYSSGDNTTTYYRASFATSSRVDVSGSGAYIDILDANMKMVNTMGSSYSPVTLPAGDYIFKIMFSSSNARSVSITSPGLP